MLNVETLLHWFLGLGTSTSKEAKEYFAEMEKHRITFKYSGAEDDAAITLVSLMRLILQVWREGRSIKIQLLLYS